MTNAAPTLMLDLSRRVDTFTHGDIQVILTWTLHDERPCLVLIPTLAVLHFDSITPCIVPIESAFMWDEHTGDGRHCATMAFQFACAMNFAPSPQILIRITSIIRDHLGDLLACPNMPKLFDDEVVADATLTNLETGAVKQSEIVKNV